MGPMGSGKSTIGKIISKTTGWPYFDNDLEMTNRYGFSQEELSTMPVSELHEIETRYLQDILNEDAPFITGAAGSVVDNQLNRELLKSAFAIYLHIPLEVIIERAGTFGVGRQAVIDSGTKILTDRYVRRDPLYREVAKLTLNIGENPEEDAEKILEFLAKS